LDKPTSKLAFETSWLRGCPEAEVTLTSLLPAAIV